MDYSSQSLWFKVKKVIRYFRLYGLAHTVMKIRGRYHMRKSYDVLPQSSVPRKQGGSVGIIGCGNYSYTIIAYFINKFRRGVIRAAMDIDLNRAASFYESYHLSYYTDKVDDIIRDPDISLVYVASNHNSHAEYAINCINAGKSVHIEKPHVVSEDQLRRLGIAMRENPKVGVFLGFNRPRSFLFRKLQRLLLEQSGPIMINWFVVGFQIPDNHWYFDDKEGSRILGNLVHWSDLTLLMVGVDKAFPCTIVSATPEYSKSDYVVSIVFADRSCATITFSAKGDTFEGVREVLNVSKGNLIANITDFQVLKADIVDKKKVFKTFFRDQGHCSNILNSLKKSNGEKFEYVFATAKLFLAIKMAVESRNTIILSREEALGQHL